MRTRGKKKQKRKGEMNSLELNYSKFLDDLMSAGKILWWAYESTTFRLAERTTYTPDFAVLLASGEIQYHETKGGYFTESARVKLKTTAEIYPHSFFLVRNKKQKDCEGYAWSKNGNLFADKTRWCDPRKLVWTYDLVPGWE